MTRLPIKVRHAMLISLIGILICGFDDLDGNIPMTPDIVFRDMKSEDAAVRQKAVKGLVSISITRKGAQAIGKNLRFLAQVIQNEHENAEVRAQTMRAVALASEQVRINQEIMPALIRLLLDERENSSVRSWIAMSLPDVAPPESAGPAILAATRSKNTAVRTNASQQISRLALDPDKLLRWLKTAIGDKQVPVRLAAVCAAASTLKRDKRALAILLTGAADKDRLVRQAVVEIFMDETVLDSTVKKGVLAAMDKMRKDQNPAISMYAAVVLLKISPNSAANEIAFLIRGLEAKDDTTRAAAAEALTFVGLQGKEAVPMLEKAARDLNERVKLHAAMALIQITKKREPYAGIIRKLSHSSDVQVMTSAKLYEAMLLPEKEDSK